MFAGRVSTQRRRGTRLRIYLAWFLVACVSHTVGSCARRRTGFVVEGAGQWRSVLWLCLRNFTGPVAGVEHGDGIFVAGPRGDVLQKGAQLKRKLDTRDKMIGAHAGERK